MNKITLQISVTWPLQRQPFNRIKEYSLLYLPSYTVLILQPWIRIVPACEFEFLQNMPVNIVDPKKTAKLLASRVEEKQIST